MIAYIAKNNSLRRIMMKTNMETRPDYNPMNEGASLLIGSSQINLFPYTYTGWRDETDSWKKTVYLGAALMNSPILDVTGPDLSRFFNRICVNNFDIFSIGRIKHAVICNDKGQIMTDGVVMKTAEDTYRTYWLNPILGYLVDKLKKEYDIVCEDLTGKEYFFQIAGPLSLKVMEKACGCDLHDLAFANHRLIKINDRDVRILRLGMTGNLAYEIHGDINDATVVYSAVWDAGKDFEMRKLGQLAYCMNHTEGGYPNIHIHYPLPWFESEDLGFEGLASYLSQFPWLAYYNYNRRLIGSLGDDLQSRFVTPIDVGWSSLIRFDHEFTGKAALELAAKTISRQVVTLEWNADDIADVYSSQFRGFEVEPYDFIEDRPNDVFYFGGDQFTYLADKVVSHDKMVGISVGRGVSNYYRRMISLAFIEPAYAKEGSELAIIWGSPGRPQKKIRARVARFPYLNFDRNNELNTNSVHE